jgi:prolyl 4-hydroxylase
MITLKFLVVAIVLIAAIFVIVRRVLFNRWCERVTLLQPPNFANATPVHTKSAPYLYTLNEFMSPEECQHFLEISKDRFERSNVTGVTGEQGHDNVRTSYSCLLRESETPIVRRVEERAASVCGVDVSNIEALQIVRYHPGQKYDAHHDYFHYPMDNQRYVTLLVYLNDDFEGGATRFVHPSVNKEIRPVAGNAAFWYNSVIHSNGANATCLPESEHQGSPPTSGVKYAVNIWIRHKRFRGV